MPYMLRCTYFDMYIFIHNITGYSSSSSSSRRNRASGSIVARNDM